MQKYKYKVFRYYKLSSCCLFVVLAFSNSSEFFQASKISYKFRNADANVQCSNWTQIVRQLFAQWVMKKRCFD
jgi:hypothetical protein